MEEHIPVLLNETIKGLSINESDIVYDGTLGRGGHANAIINKLGRDGTYIGVDLDVDSILSSKKILKNPNRAEIFLFQENFKNIDKVLEEAKKKNIDKALLDLGWNTVQMKNGKRGFSFEVDEPLLMTYNDTQNNNLFTAYDVVNSWEEKNLADIIYNYSGERSSRKIAKAIVETRKEKKIETSRELAEIIESVRPRRGAIHPATKTFQAIRIVVNDELRTLKEALENIWNKTNKNGKLAIISFHSGEDRIVKHFFQNKHRQKELELYTKKPITPSDEEVKANNKSRSAKLRIIKKLI